ncbi:hypothetical protein [Piscibacillus salipiscarius]|uniref:hypothetical protein n=1 Tax=Piscibacillus salipiscarius TaxID=299480 RepID=UPI0006D1BA17|nr:hypothetical protein [Piscibacillus salipiscarius]
MLTETFNHLLNEYGKDVYLNDETTSRKALINSTSVTSSYKENFDDHIIHTNFPIQRGDTITINNEIFIVVSDVQLKSDYEYKATIRPCDQTIEVIVIEQN